MQTIGTIRRARLRMLKEHFRSLAAINRAIGRNSRDATLSQILNASPDKSRNGKPREMGAQQARAIESALGLPRGWFDVDPHVQLFPVKAALNRLADNGVVIALGSTPAPPRATAQLA